MQKKKAKDNSSSLGAVEKNQGSQHEKLEINDLYLVQLVEPDEEAEHDHD